MGSGRFKKGRRLFLMIRFQKDGTVYDTFEKKRFLYIRSCGVTPFGLL